MIQVGTTVEICREPPYKEYDVHVDDIGVVTYIASTGKYSVKINGKHNPHYDPDRKYGNNGEFWIPKDCVREYKFRQGDRVKIVSPTSKYKGYYATVYSEYYGNRNCSNSVRLFVDGTNYQPSGYHNKYLTLVKTSVQLINNNEREEDNMNKLTGYNKVAVIKMSGANYCYALYDNDVKVGDTVLVSGSCSNAVVVDEILTIEEAKTRTNKDITAEVKCKVNLSAYNKRIENRVKAAELRKEMDKKIAEMDKINKYVLYAEKDPELAKMLEIYMDLV